MFRRIFIALIVAGVAIYLNDRESPIIIAPSATPPTNPADYVVKGQVRVIDGDTFSIGKVRIRLAGIDTPESCQKGYREAKAHLVGLVQGFPVTCRATGKSYERIVAFCSTISLADVSAQMVSDGFAVDWPKYSEGVYSEEQADAVSARRGLWRSLSPWLPAETHHVCP